MGAQLGVKTPFEHSKLVIAIDQTSAHWGVGDFAKNEANGIQWITIGAGPDAKRDSAYGKMGNGEWMWAGTNRPTDLTLPRLNQQAIAVPGQYADLDAAITTLLTMIGAYNQNPVHYTLFPGGGTRGLNSNGFIHGLLDAGGFASPTDPGGRIPGWVPVVPPSQFGVGP